MSEPTDFEQLYLSESRDHLEVLGRAVLGIERGEGQRAVDEGFRAVHTLKGMAAAIGHRTVVGLAHSLEYLLDQLRSGSMRADRGIIDVMLAAIDELERAIEARRAPPGGESYPAEAEVDEGDGETRPAAARLVRVEESRVDALMDRASGLISARERLLRRARQLDDPEMRSVAEELGRWLSELREDALRLRLAPVEEVVDRLQRLVRDAARQGGKEVQLEVRGLDVELDRALLGDFGDLLTHLLRNAVDHGIEPPAEREAVNKPREGRITVSAIAAHDAVKVRVADDGRGIDVDAVRMRAELMGFAIAGSDAPSSAELADLLTRPGFTTAARVTELSGRGVGLDHVATRLRELGGSLEIETDSGRGTTFAIRVPKTLALTRVLLVRCGAETIALRLLSLDRVEDGPEPYARAAMPAWEELSAERIRVDLGRYLACRGSEPKSRWDGGAARGFVAVVSGGGRSIELIVDGLLGFQDVVVRRVALPRQVKGYFSGAAVLSNGEPCMVLEPGRLLSASPEPIGGAIGSFNGTSR